MADPTLMAAAHARSKARKANDRAAAREKSGEKLSYYDGVNLFHIAMGRFMLPQHQEKNLPILYRLPYNMCGEILDNQNLILSTYAYGYQIVNAMRTRVSMEALEVPDDPFYRTTSHNIDNIHTYWRGDPSFVSPKLVDTRNNDEESAAWLAEHNRYFEEKITKSKNKPHELNKSRQNLDKPLDVSQVVTEIRQTKKGVAESRQGITDMRQDIAESRQGITDMRQDIAESRKLIAETKDMIIDMHAKLEMILAEITASKK